MNTITRCLLLSFFFTLIGGAPESKKTRFIIKLHHRASPQSPFFNPNQTKHQVMLEDSKLSFERASYIKMSSLPYSTEQIGVGPRSNLPGLLFAYTLIGSNNQEMGLIVDTGSSLTWTLCDPCDWCDLRHLSFKPFYPNLSQTYQPYACDSPQCATDFLTPAIPYCIPSLNECHYYIKYLSGSSLGTLSSETFGSLDFSSSALEKVTFGCTRSAKNRGYAIRKFSGILGLGMGNISIVKQAGYQSFSYCVSDLYDFPSYHKLVFGPPLLNNAYYSRLIPGDRHYVVNLFEITFGDVIFRTTPDEIRDDYDYDGGVVFDTGASISYLQGPSYLKLENAIQNFARGKLLRAFPEHENRGRFCYNVPSKDMLYSFPDIVFTFFGLGRPGLVVKFSTLFSDELPDSSIRCSIIKNSDEVSVPYSIFGISLQQYHYIIYNLDFMAIGFLPVASCNISTSDARYNHL